MTADLTNGRGFVVKNAGNGGNVMDVKIPNYSQALGKITHPAQATLYKVQWRKRKEGG